MTLVEFVQEWGYIAVFLGSLVEGESIILPAAAFASQGILSFWKIVFISFLGTLIADQTLFHIGRAFGDRFLRRFTRIEPLAQKAFNFLNSYGTMYILLFRFIYGVRTISPIVIGASSITYKHFSILNIIASALWSLLSCSVGYWGGSAFMSYFTPNQRWAILGGTIMGIVVYVGFKLRRLWNR